MLNEFLDPQKRSIVVLSDNPTPIQLIATFGDAACRMSTTVGARVCARGKIREAAQRTYEDRDGGERSPPDPTLFSYWAEDR